MFSGNAKIVKKNLKTNTVTRMVATVQQVQILVYQDKILLRKIFVKCVFMIMLIIKLKIEDYFGDILEQFMMNVGLNSMKDVQSMLLVS